MQHHLFVQLDLLGDIHHLAHQMGKVTSRKLITGAPLLEDPIKAEVFHRLHHQRSRQFDLEVLLQPAPEFGGRGSLIRFQGQDQDLFGFAGPSPERVQVVLQEARVCNNLVEVFSLDHPGPFPIQDLDQIGAGSLDQVGMAAGDLQDALDGGFPVFPTDLHLLQGFGDQSGGIPGFQELDPHGVAEIEEGGVGVPQPVQQGPLATEEEVGRLIPFGHPEGPEEALGAFRVFAQDQVHLVEDELDRGARVAGSQSVQQSPENGR